MNNEFNSRDYQEAKSFSDGWQASELNKNAQEFVSSKQNAPPQETSLSSKKSSKKSGAKKGKGIALANMLVATVVTVTTTVGSGIVNPRQAKVDLKEIWAGVQEISYQIEVLETEAELVVTLENDFTSRQEKLTVGENEGEFTNLAPDMQYTLSVRFADGLKETVEKRTVKTNGKNPKPEPTPDPTPEPTPEIEPDVKFEFEPASSTDKTISFTVHIKDELLTDCTQVFVKIYDGDERNYPTIEEKIYNIDEIDPEYNENRLGQKVEIDIDGEFSLSSGFVEIVVYKPKDNPSNSTDTSDMYEMVSVYQEEIEIFTGNTSIQSVAVSPAESDGFLRITVEFIDENGLWMLNNNGAEDYMLLVEITDPTYASGYFERFILTSGQTLEIEIPKDEYLDGFANIEIYCTTTSGAMQTVYYEEYVEIVGANFDRN